MLRTTLLLLFTSITLFGQNPYPQDYFQSPLDITLVLSGTFAELRSNHFHSGLDIKTQQRKGLKVYGIADGYVSRIKVSHFGYGKALYITHPNGYTSVYAHLEKFSDAIEAYVKQCQYEKETYEIELFPSVDELAITKGNIVAYSGNSGSSGGPHLHFEIRDKKERPINPMLFGIDIKDTTKPVITRVYGYPIGQDAHINASKLKQELRLVQKKSGDYTVEGIEAKGKIGFAIGTNDRQDLAANRNGVYNIQSNFNGNRLLEIDFKRFSFSETKHLNRLIDYKHFKTKKQRLTKLFVEPNNPLSLYNIHQNNGYVQVEDSSSNTFKVRIRDFKDNEVWLTIPITGKAAQDVKLKDSLVTNHYIKHDQVNNLKEGIVDATFYKDTFYDDFYINFEVNADTLKLHEPHIPAKKSFSIKYDISQFQTPDKSKLYISRLIGYNNKPIYTITKRKANTLSTTTKSLGTYALAVDTIPPVISPKNFQDNKWLSKYRYLKIRIDDLHTGISAYRATINGQWILMEYDYKTKTLVYDFNDAVIKDTKNNLKIIVTDNVGNSSTFEATFFRK